MAEENNKDFSLSLKVAIKVDFISIRTGNNINSHEFEKFDINDLKSLNKTLISIRKTIYEINGKEEIDGGK